MSEHDIAPARIVAFRERIDRADDQIVETVMVDVACSGNRSATEVVTGCTIHAEPVASVQRAERDICRKTVAAKHDITAAAAGSIGIGKRRANEKIIEAVAIDIAGAGDRITTPVESGRAGQAKSVAAIKRRQIKAGDKTTDPAEYHEAATAETPVRVGEWRADQQIGDAIAVDIACTGYRQAGGIADGFAVETKPVAAVELGELDRTRTRKRTRSEENSTNDCGHQACQAIVHGARSSTHPDVPRHPATERVSPNSGRRFGPFIRCTARQFDRVEPENSSTPFPAGWNKTSLDCWRNPDSEGVAAF
ncbi:MAG TPA: hypothetical protein PKC03_14705 [Dokdonella sp.]|nr:hypothetical protein [Dokdonella sp.]